MANETLYLVDGTSQLFRAFYALPPLTNREKLPTNAVLGFTTMLRKLMNDEKPEHLAVAFDLPGPTFRHDKYAEYKANRPPAPEDLNRQTPYATDVCRALGIPVLELSGYEADDVIATFARLGKEAGFDIVVVASDKDLMQLVEDGVLLLNPAKNLRLDDAGVEETFGVPPVFVRDVLGLMGDSVDNIPGVPGVGSKTALAMVQRYGPVEKVVERAKRFVNLFDARQRLLDLLGKADKENPLTEETVTETVAAVDTFAAALDDLRANEVDDEFRKRLDEVDAILRATPTAALPAKSGNPGRAALRDWKDLKRALKELEKKSARRMWYSVVENEDKAVLSRELATVDREVPLELDTSALAVGSADREKLRTLFEFLDFRALTKELDAEGDPPEPVEAPPEEIAYRVVRERGDLEAFAVSCRTSRRLAVYVLGDRTDPMQARLVGLAMAHEPREAVYVPVAHEGLTSGAQLGLETVCEVLRPLFADAGVSKVAHDLKWHLHLLRRHGLEVSGWGLDSMVAAFLLDPGRSGYAIEILSEEYLGHRCTPYEKIGGSGAKRINVDQVPIESATGYGAERADVALRLAENLAGRLDEAGLRDLYDRIDGPLVPVLASMEAWGIGVDRGILEAMSAEMKTELDRTRAEIVELAGVEFNVDSPKQLREVLFEKLGLKRGRKTAKSKVSSTDAQTLEELDHPIAAKLLEYRELAKLKGTYVDSLPQLINPTTGRVHTRYNPTGAATGRLSSSDPNLQNIPARTDAGLRIRMAFVPAPGFVFLASDYSQVELRILAHLTDDAELIDAFRRGEDIHRHTASKVFGVEPDEVTGAMRRRAKAVNFGVIYGMSETRLARDQGIPRAEAGQFIRTYFDRFSGVRAYIERVREEATRDAAARTLLGRVRYFPQLSGRAGRAIREQALRGAVNTTVQGTAADLMKIAMLGVYRFLDESRSEARILLQVHDELLLEVPEGEIEAVGEGVRRAMEDVYPLEVPLAVDQKTGGSWMAVT
jgi:DNA polymerase-1